MKLLFISLITVLHISLADGITLQSVFDSAGPGNGYDKHVILMQDEVYTGGLGIYEGDIFIDGNGAIIDLQEGSGIWIYADDAYPASLEIQFCSIINGGYYGLSYGGTATGIINNCNFVRNDMGVKLYDDSYVEIKNSNFIENITYGVGIYSMTPICNINFCNTWNNGEAPWMENCPGWGNIWTPWEPEAGLGIIDTNPLFVNLDEWNFNYQSDSPCINAGDPSESDPDGSIRDIGALWFGDETSPGDCNSDGIQNVIDIVLVINDCILGDNMECSCGDINQDGTVNVLDVVSLVNLILSP